MDRFTGTREVAARHAFAVEPLEAWLAANVDDARGPWQAAQFKGGQSNPTYLLTSPTRRLVLRSKPGPVAKLLPSAHAIEREYRVMAALAATDVPVPPMVALCEDEAVIGRAFYLMGHIDGRVLWDPTLPGMSRDERAAHYDAMNRTLAALHSVDPQAVGLAGYGKPGNYFERQIDRWSRQYVASQTGAIEAMDALLEWLPAHLPASARDEATPRIVHGDFRLDNLVFHPQRAEVVAVLDWELSTLGHPLADLAYHCMSWHIPPGTFRGLGGVDVASLGIPDERAYIRRYAERTGRADAASLATLERDWPYFLAYNLFRLASITQGIARRVVDGTASSAEAQATGAATRPLAELALRHARRVDPHGLPATP